MCECEVCQLSRKVHEKLELLPEDQRAFWEEMYDALVHAEFDRDYYRSVIDGSWPNSDLVIERVRTHRASKDVQQIENSV